MYNYYLKRKGRGRFPADALAAMHERVRQMPSYAASDSLYILFDTPEERDGALPWLSRRLKEEGYDQWHPRIQIDAKELTLSVAGGSDADRHLYDFALWCQEKYPGLLLLGEVGDPASPEDMVPEELFIMPEHLPDEDSPALPEDMAEK